MDKDLAIKNQGALAASYDNFFELELLKEEVSEKKDYASQIIDKAADALIGGGYLDAYRKSKDDLRFELVLTPEMKAALKDQTKKFDKSKTGELFAQIRGADGRLSEKIPIKKISDLAEIDPTDLSNALRMKAIEEKLDSIVETLEEISIGIEDVLAGQDNDRIGLYCSGMNLYREAMQISDPMMRTLLTAQSIKTISDANAQEVQCVIRDVDYLVKGKHLKLKKPKDEVTKRIGNINKCLQVVHKSAVFKAGIYYRQNELAAMVESLDEYGRFLDRVIVPNVGKLSEMDASEKFIGGSKWSRKADFLEIIEDIRYTLPNDIPRIEESRNGEEG